MKVTVTHDEPNSTSSIHVETFVLGGDRIYSHEMAPGQSCQFDMLAGQMLSVTEIVAEVTAPTAVQEEVAAPPFVNTSATLEANTTEVVAQAEPVDAPTPDTLYPVEPTT